MLCSLTVPSCIEGFETPFIENWKEHSYSYKFPYYKVKFLISNCVILSFLGQKLSVLSKGIP